VATPARRRWWRGHLAATAGEEPKRVRHGLTGGSLDPKHECASPVSTRSFNSSSVAARQERRVAATGGASGGRRRQRGLAGCPCRGTPVFRLIRSVRL
jgi:hypothetical protein